MGLDSVEIVMGWEAAFGIGLDDDEVFAVRTPRMAIDLIARKLGAIDESPQGCLTLRAFNQLRKSFMCVRSVNRRSFLPTTRLKDLATRDQWEAIRSNCGIPSLPKPGIFSPRTVAELTRWAVIYGTKDLKNASEPWTKAEIRTIVRAVVTDNTGIDKFGDDDDFIKDILIDG